MSLVFLLPTHHFHSHKHTALTQNLSYKSAMRPPKPVGVLIITAGLAVATLIFMSCSVSSRTTLPSLKVILLLSEVAESNTRSYRRA